MFCSRLNSVWCSSIGLVILNIGNGGICVVSVRFLVCVFGMNCWIILVIILFRLIGFSVGDVLWFFSLDRFSSEWNSKLMVVVFEVNCFISGVKDFDWLCVCSVFISNMIVCIG